MFLPSHQHHVSNSEGERSGSEGGGSWPARRGRKRRGPPPAGGARSGDGHPRLEVLLDALERERARLDRGTGIAVGVTPPAEDLPGGREPVLPAGQVGLLRPYVLEEQEPAAGAQDPAGLAEG